MAAWDHWHPVVDARRLKRRPIGIRLLGREIVLFRSGATVGALDDCCPHRRMRLSLGSVEDGHLRCCYHGWRFDPLGNGESPGTPKLHAHATAYETREERGAIWLRRRGSNQPFPHFDVESFHHVGNLFHSVRVPLELVVDNFTEVEHTPTTHALLGYELARMAEVETRVEASADRVRIFNAGPQKRIDRHLEMLFGVRSGDRFVDDWTTFFSPVFSVYDQYWSDPSTGQEHGLRFRILVFFTPEDDQTTSLATFVHIRRTPSWQSRLARLAILRPYLLHVVNREVQLDVRMMENLADKRPEVEGMKLSRFDKPLALHRERIRQIYRGEPVGAPPGTGPGMAG